jgi:hypothetical protein
MQELIIFVRGIAISLARFFNTIDGMSPGMVDGLVLMCFNVFLTFDCEICGIESL